MDRASDARRAIRRSARAQRPPRDGRELPLQKVILVAAALLFLAVAGITVFQLMHGEEVYPGVSIGNIQLGGTTKSAAMAKLRPWLGQRESQPIVVRGPESTKNVTPTDLGATFDAAAAVEAAYAVGRTGGIAERLGSQMRALTGGYQVEAPGLRIDRARLSAFVAQQASEIDRPVRGSEIKINTNLTVSVSPSVIGRKLNQAAAVSALEQALGTGSAVIDLPVVETRPKVTEKDVEDVRAKAAKMLSGPVTLTFESSKWSLSAKEIADAISIDQKPDNPVPALSLKEDSFKKLVDKAAGEVDQPKVNARFDWNGGKLKLLKGGQDGRLVDRTQALATLTGALNSDQRSVALPVKVDKAAGASIDPSQLGIKDKIETATTSFYGSVPEKAHNIKLAASRLNGVLLAPGDVFSFNRELGPTTLKSGFQIGFGIAVTNGEMQTVPSVAGGICQVATTLLHTIFNAGYQLEERYPHAYWIQSYGQPPKGMVGLDATVDDPNLDLKFKNNTNDYLLIQAGVQDSTVTFSLYGTKPKWKVEIDQPAISNIVKADTATVRQEEPTWSVGRELWVERATDGMDVVVTRRVIDGGDVRTLNLKSHYAPSGNVLMVGSAPVTPTATPTPEGGATPAPAATQPAASVTPQPAGTGAAQPAATKAAPSPTKTAAAPTKPAATPTPKPPASSTP